MGRGVYGKTLALGGALGTTPDGNHRLCLSPVRVAHRWNITECGLESVRLWSPVSWYLGGDVLTIVCLCMHIHCIHTLHCIIIPKLSGVKCLLDETVARQVAIQPNM